MKKPTKQMLPAIIDYNPVLTNWVARWANAMAILETLSLEVQELNAMVRSASDLGPLRIDTEAVAKMAHAMIGLSEDLSVPPFRGSLDRIGNG